MESESEKTRLKIEFTDESGMISAPILDSLLVDNSPSPPRYISGDPNEQNHHQDLPRNSDLTIKAEDLKEEPMETDMPDQVRYEYSQNLSISNCLMAIITSFINSVKTFHRLVLRPFSSKL